MTWTFSTTAVPTSTQNTTATTSVPPPPPQNTTTTSAPPPPPQNTTTTAAPPPPPTTTAPPPPPATPTPDPNSPDCRACRDSVGGSTCPGSDPACTYNWCKYTSSCQKCGLDCARFVGGTKPSGKPDSKSPPCTDCGDTLGASTCKDLTCLKDQCKNNFSCAVCEFNCDGL